MVLYELLEYLVLIVAMTQWLLQVVAHVMPTPHVVVAFAAFLERFVEDPPTTVDFLVLVQQSFLSSTATPRKYIDILER